MDGARDIMETVTTSEEKWGKAAIAGGFTIIPNHVLSMNQFLPEESRVSPTEMVVLLQILSSWWSRDKMPFPSKATIGQRAGLSPRQVQRALTSLEEKGFIERQVRLGRNKGRTSNQFNMNGVASKIADIANANPNAFRASSQSKPEDRV